MDDNNVKSFGECAECGSEIIFSDEFPYDAECYYCEETSLFFDSIECILAHYGIRKIEP